MTLPWLTGWFTWKADDLLLVAPRTLSARSEYIFLFTLVLLGAVLRLATLSHDSLWADEAYTLSVSQLSFTHLWSIPFDVHPPLFYSLVKIFLGFGLSESTVRIASALASTLALFPVYFLARWLIGNVGALATLAVSSTSYTNLVYADDARNYALLSAFLILCFMALFRASQILRTRSHLRNRTFLVWAAAYNLSAICALYTHNTAVFYIAFANAAWALYVLIDRPADAIGYALKLIGLNALVVLAWLPWLANLFSASADFGWLKQASPSEAIKTLLVTILPNNSGILGALVCLAAIGTGAVIALHRCGKLLTVACFHLLAFPFIIWIVGFVYTPIYIERTILPAIFGGALCIGISLAFLRSQRAVLLVAGLVMFACIISTASYLGRGHEADHYGAHIVQDWRSAVADSPEGDRNALVICEIFVHPAVSFYTSDTRILISRPDHSLWPVTDDQWRTLNGLPASARRPDIDKTLGRILAVDGVSAISLNELAARYNHITTLRANTFCDDSFLSSPMETLQRAGFEAGPVRTYPGVTARTFNRRSAPK